MKKKFRVVRKQEFVYPVEHSKHSKRRARQRAITEGHIQAALNYSEGFFKQGMIFHVVKSKLIPETFDPSLRQRIQNLVIVIAGDSNKIITCYKADKPMSWIKKKPKELHKYKMVG
jgi:hypothetical protein